MALFLAGKQYRIDLWRYRHMSKSTYSIGL